MLESLPALQTKKAAAAEVRRSQEAQQVPGGARAGGCRRCEAQSLGPASKKRPDRILRGLIGHCVEQGFIWGLMASKSCRSDLYGCLLDKITPRKETSGSKVKGTSKLAANC